jgi:hypothetical protein
MSIGSVMRDLVNVRIAGKSSMDERVSVTQTTVSRGVFITPQSLLTFPVAAGFIRVAWELASLFREDFGDNIVVPTVISAFVGIVIYLISIRDDMNLKDHLIAAAITLMNTILLLASVLGIKTVI